MTANSCRTNERSRRPKGRPNTKIHAHTKTHAHMFTHTHVYYVIYMFTWNLNAQQTAAKGEEEDVPKKARTRKYTTSYVTYRLFKY